MPKHLHILENVPYMARKSTLE